MSDTEAKIKVVFTGLNGAGKTSILRVIKDPKARIENLAPTIGFNLESLYIAGNDIRLVTWDASGQAQYRTSWQLLLKGANLMVYVVDAADKSRFSEAKDELIVLLDTEAKLMPWLLVANKQDLENAVPADQLLDALDVRNNLRNIKCSVVGTSALKKEGVEIIVPTIFEMLDDLEEESGTE
ncbi:MAG: ADP-ribosylation factor-like protein [Candidatus Hodarchaeota archaeon]